MNNNLSLSTIISLPLFLSTDDENTEEHECVRILFWSDSKSVRTKSGALHADFFWTKNCYKSPCISLSFKTLKQDLLHGMGYFNLSEWKAPFSLIFQKISRIWEGSYLSEFQNERGSNPSENLDFLCQKCPYQKFKF